MVYMDKNDETKTDDIIEALSKYVRIIINPQYHFPNSKKGKSKKDDYSDDEEEEADEKDLPEFDKYGLPYKIKFIMNIRTRLVQTMLEKINPTPDIISQKWDSSYFLAEYHDYLNMLCRISEDFIGSEVIRQEKTTFCLFLGITTKTYDYVLEHGNDAQKLALNTIDACLIEETLSNMENKAIDMHSGKLRLQIKDVGHSVTTKESDNQNDALKRLSENMRSNEVQSILDLANSRTALISNKRKSNLQ